MEQQEEKIAHPNSPRSPLVDWPCHLPAASSFSTKVAHPIPNFQMTKREFVRETQEWCGGGRARWSTAPIARDPAGRTEAKAHLERPCRVEPLQARRFHLHSPTQTRTAGPEPSPLQADSRPRSDIYWSARARHDNRQAHLRVNGVLCLFSYEHVCPLRRHGVQMGSSREHCKD